MEGDGYTSSRCFVNTGNILGDLPAGESFPILGVNSRQPGGTESQFLRAMFNRCTTSRFQTAPDTGITDSTNYRYLDIYLTYIGPDGSEGQPGLDTPIYIYIADPIGANNGINSRGEHAQLPVLGYWDNTRNAEAYGAQGKLRANEFNEQAFAMITTWVMNIISTQNLLPLLRSRLNAGDVIKFTTDYYPSRKSSQQGFHKDSKDGRTIYFGLMYDNPEYMLGPDVKTGIMIPTVDGSRTQADPATHPMGHFPMSAIRPIIPPNGGVWLNDLLLHHSTPDISGVGAQMDGGPQRNRAHIKDSQYPLHPESGDRRLLTLPPARLRADWDNSRVILQRHLEDDQELRKMNTDLTKAARERRDDIARGEDTSRPAFCRVWIQTVEKNRFLSDYDTRKGFDELSLAKLINVDRDALKTVEDYFTTGPGSRTHPQLRITQPGGVADQALSDLGIEIADRMSGRPNYISYQERATPRLQAWQENIGRHFQNDVLQVMNVSIQSGLLLASSSATPGGMLNLDRIMALNANSEAEEDIRTIDPPLTIPLGGNVNDVALSLNEMINRLAHQEDWNRGLPNIGGSRKTRRKGRKRHKSKKTASRRPKSNKKLKKTKTKSKKKVKKSRKQYRSK